jgi:hypothetical protein
MAQALAKLRDEPRLAELMERNTTR